MPAEPVDRPFVAVRQPIPRGPHSPTWLTTLPCSCRGSRFADGISPAADSLTAITLSRIELSPLPDRSLGLRPWAHRITTQEPFVNEMAHSDAEPAVEDQDGGGPSEDDGFSERVLNSFFDIFWNPEIQRRGGIDATGPIYAALAVLAPGEPTDVRLNEEVRIVAKAKSGSLVSPGDPVTPENLNNVEEFEPLAVDPNAGWAMWMILPDGRQYARFDLLRNRARSLRLIALARGYIATAQAALQAEHLGPALENAMAAAELAVTAHSYVFTTDTPTSGGRRNSHSSRQRWTKVQVGLGNTTPDAHQTLVALGQVRPAARYGEGELPPVAQAANLVSAVEDLVEHSAARVGSLLRTQDPAFIAELQQAMGDESRDGASS